MTLPEIVGGFHPDGGTKSAAVKVPFWPEPTRAEGTVTWTHCTKWLGYWRVLMSLYTVRSRVTLALPGTKAVPFLNWATTYRSLPAPTTPAIPRHPNALVSKDRMIPF